MTDLNEDGLAPGSEVDFATIQRISRTPKAAITREDIAKMKKGDVIELLEAHGAESVEGSVADLRAALIAIMFTDI